MSSIARNSLVCLLALAPLGAQQPADSARAAREARMRVDSARVLPGITVSVSRLPAVNGQASWSVASLTGEALRRARPGLGIDEALPAMAGVIVNNRYNYSVDQRLSIRGAGSRANFGLRGVKVLLDGIPQSLPDGQSQLSNVDLSSLGAVEVLRGSASSLYGNGTGGVLSFSTDLSSAGALDASLRTMAGSAGLRRTEARLAGHGQRLLGALSASRTSLEGARQYSAADVRQLNAGADYALGASATASLRLALNETPRAENPGALTAAEYAVNTDSASASNILRGARRAISQRQLSLRLHGQARHGLAWGAAVYGIRRFVDNPLATPPPGGGLLNGTYSTLDRRVTGLRLDASWQALSRRGAPTLSAGLDAQRSFDVRRNRRDTRGRIATGSDSLFLDQGETVTSVGPFVQGAWSPLGALRLSAGARHDALRFAVADHFLGDRVDDSGSRTLSATSVQGGVTVIKWARWTPYANLSTAFETPTTTELNARPDGAGGFNEQLGPQRVRSAEVGLRARPVAALRVEASVYESRARDAIVQYLAVDGRSFFRNAGRTRTRGAELAIRAQLHPTLAAHAALTLTDARFTSYRVSRGTTVDTLDGRRMAGVPRAFTRLGLRWQRGGWYLGADQTVSGAVYADDLNRQRVRGWGRGALDVRGAWRMRLHGQEVEPFGGVTNALATRYVGAVTINGAGGRVLEPAPGRQWYLGVGLRHP
ncbi:MAG: TonB-dependent receptor [Gemmatimonadaceae bacterium]